MYIYSYILFPTHPAMVYDGMTALPTLYRLSWILYHGSIASLLIVIALYDIQHKVIPQLLVYTFTFLSFVHWFFPLLFGNDFFVFPETYDLLAPFIFFFFFAGLWYFSGGRAIGFGDAKLVLPMGVVLGLPVGISAITIAFWIGAIYAVGSMLYSRRRGDGTVGMKSEVPFAPFLIIGYFIAFFIQPDLFYLKDIFAMI